MKKLILLIAGLFVLTATQLTASPGLSGYGLKFSGNNSASAPYLLFDLDNSGDNMVILAHNPSSYDGTGYFYGGFRLKKIEVGFSRVGLHDSVNLSMLSDIALFKTSVGVVVYAQRGDVAFESSVYMPVIF